MLQGLGGDQVTRLSGIVNGTCNYILSRMELGRTTLPCLRMRNSLGMRSRTPRPMLMVDARAKLCILSRIAMHAELDPDAVATQTISTIEAIDFSYAKELNCTIRQVSRAELNGKLMHARVAPMLVPLTCRWPGRMARRIWCRKRKVWRGRCFLRSWCGGEPTAVAVVSDLLAVAQGCSSVQLPVRKREVTGDFLRHTICASSSMISRELFRRSPARSRR